MGETQNEFSSFGEFVEAAIERVRMDPPHVGEDAGQRRLDVAPSSMWGGFDCDDTNDSRRASVLARRRLPLRADRRGTEKEAPPRLATRHLRERRADRAGWPYPAKPIGTRVIGGNRLPVGPRPGHGPRPDFAFIRQERIPAGLPNEAYWPGAPDLAVEVLSAATRCAKWTKRSRTGLLPGRRWFGWSVRSGAV